MGEHLNRQMSELLNKAVLTLTKYEAEIKEAEEIMSRKDPPPTQPPPPPASPENQQSTPSAPTQAMFRLYSNLKPSMLEKECTFQEVCHFKELWSSYIEAGYGSKKNIPQDMLHIQLKPFITPSWWAQLLEKGIKEKTFEEIPDTIKAVASRFITLHDKRLDFLKSKRGNMSHTDFLLLLENKIDQTNFNGMVPGSDVRHSLLNLRRCGDE